ncbi:MAG: hypothetical protein ACJ74U_08990 [Jatrophihabitantaceae bacterium]
MEAHSLARQRLLAFMGFSARRDHNVPRDHHEVALVVKFLASEKIYARPVMPGRLRLKPQKLGLRHRLRYFNWADALTRSILSELRRLERTPSYMQMPRLDRDRFVLDVAKRRYRKNLYRTRTLVFASLIGLALAVLGAEIVTVAGSSKFLNIAGTIIYGVGLLGMISPSILSLRINPQRRALSMAITLIRLVDVPAERYNTLQHQRRIVRKLERYASYVERIPGLYRWSLGQVDSAPLYVSASLKAEFARQKKHGIFESDASQPSLLADLWAAAICLSKDRWLDLPDVSAGAVPRRKSLIRQAAVYVAILALIGGLIIIGIYSRALGANATILSSLVSLLIVAALARAGLTTTVLNSAMDAAEKMQRNDVSQP